MLRLALALLLPLTIVACSGGTQPAALGPEAAASPQAQAPAPEPENVATAEPEADPVEAAVREYVAAANVAMSTGDTERFRRAVTPECTCLAFADTIDEMRVTGESIRGAHWDAIEYRSSGSRGETATGLLELRESGYEFVAPTGVVREAVPASTFTQWVRTTATSGRWLVSDVDELG